MSQVQQLITEHLDIWTAADTGKKSGRGRASSNAGSVYGIRKLRELILELAVRGKLVPQDANDEPASELLKRFQIEKMKLLNSGKLKKEKEKDQVTEKRGGRSQNPPKGWLTTDLSTITLTLNQGVNTAADKVVYEDAGYKILQSKHITTGEISDDDARFVSSIDFEVYKERFSPQLNDILFTNIGTIGKSVIVQDQIDFLVAWNLFIIRPCSELSSSYLKIILDSLDSSGYFDSLTSGSATKFISKANMGSTEIPLPPTEEQHRIVAKVDELMALCDQLEAQHSNAGYAHEQLVSHLLGTLTQSQDATDFNNNWQRITTHFDTLFTTESSIDTLKQTLLQLAVMGKLVPQDPKDEPASELLKRIQTEKAKLIAEGKIKKDKPLAAIAESPFDLPPNWAWARFPEIGEFGRGKSKHRPRNDPKLFNPGIYPLVQTGEVARADNLISEYHSKYSDIGLAQSKMWPTGTMCITIAANIADSAILGFDACFPDSVVGFVPYMPLKDARYFLSFMKTAREDLLKFAPATAQKNINLEILESVLIPIPPLNEISRIVTKVDELMTLCERLKSRITDARQNQQKLADVLVEQSLVA